MTSYLKMTVKASTIAVQFCESIVCFMINWHILFLFFEGGNHIFKFNVCLFQMNEKSKNFNELFVIFLGGKRLNQNLLQKCLR